MRNNKNEFAASGVRMDRKPLNEYEAAVWMS